jgi:hypothetical protein
VPAEIRDVFAFLYDRLAVAARLREEAFFALSPEERSKVAEGLPGYFIRPGPTGETIVGYTTDTSHCVALLDLLRKVDFAKLSAAGFVLAAAGDSARPALEAFVPPAGESAFAARLVFSADTPCGRVGIGGTGDDTFADEFALFLDLGGNDVYRNHPAHASLDGFGAAMHIDVRGDDTYRSDRFAQGSAVGGTALFMDLGGDDQYVSGHFSQGAALGGTCLFFEGGGDDSYSGDFGAQCFALFGTSIFAERGGRDSYRVGSMGQAAASTLGVAILAEGGGDDSFRAGGKHGFYEKTDAACAQGAASGMRMWPPSTGITVYGGIGFLSEAAGEDTFDLAIIGQGSSYIFSLGMLVDSAGKDAYRSERYARGVGVHLSAGVFVDRAGDDVRTGFYGNDGYSLDRCSGVFLDLAGDDVYRTLGGLGFGHKPKGTGIFVDAAGNDTYAGTGLNHGRADILFGDDAYSTGFFLDLGGKDAYPAAEYGNDRTWEEGEFGYGEDTILGKPTATGEGSFAPRPATPRADDPLGAPSSLERFAAVDPAKRPWQDLLAAAAKAAGSGDRNVRRHLIDLVQMVLSRKLVEAAAIDPLPWLAAADPDMRLLGVAIAREAKAAPPPVSERLCALSTGDPSDEVRGMAGLALGAAGVEAAAGPLAQGLSDPAWRVRRRAAIAMAELRSPATLPAALRALGEDPAFQVRGFAARTLGRLKGAEARAALEGALADPSEFVRALAAEALLTGFADKAAMKPLIALLDWSVGPLKERFVQMTLTDLTGQSRPMERAGWEKWWAEAEATFDLAAAARAVDRLADARKRRDEGKTDEAVALYREVRAAVPGHAGAGRDLAELLNAKAWKMAVAGMDLPAALALARESVEAAPGSQNIDTLAVLLFLTDDREEAEGTLVKAMEGASEADRALFERRLAEVRAGKVDLQ